MSVGVMKDYKLKLWKLRPWVARDTRFLRNCAIQGGKSRNISQHYPVSHVLGRCPTRHIFCHQSYTRGHSFYQKLYFLVQAMCAVRVIR